jgi:hypothetical protein
MKKVFRFRFFAACALLAVSAAAAHAGTLAFTFDNTTGESLSDGPFTLGWSFTVNSGIDVTALGVFSDSEDGLAESHDVGLWDSAGDLLASTTVDAGTVDPLDDQFRMVEIAPVALTAGSTYYIGAVWLDGADDMTFPGDAVNFATAPEVTFVTSQYVVAGSLTFPGTSYTSDPAYFGPNFEFTDAVPEPSYMVALAALGLAVVAGRRRFVRGN